MRGTRCFVAFLLMTLVSALPVYASGPITGQVINSVTKQPIKGAIITLDNGVVQGDDNGMFTVPNSATRIAARAPGYLRTVMYSLSPRTKSPLEFRLQPFTPKALYLTFYGIGDRKLRDAALRLIDETELNALVIDVKGDKGVITYKSSIPMASEIGAQKLIIVKDIKGLIKSLKARGIYTIARIVAFKDNTLGTARPDLTIKTQDGKIWRDRENLTWVNPASREVWNYNINIAVEAARNGFDEIQFDYVRFPDRKGLKFTVPNTEASRVGAISGFLAEAKKRLAPYNVFMAADIFGYVSWNLDDTQIGQRLDRVLPCVDYVSLMLYPSGFQFGIPGYRNPVAHPYEIVSLSLKKSRERTNVSSLRFRPWLQAFKDYAFDKRHFYGPEIRSQIKAADEFGSNGWMLWNPRNVYMPDGLKKKTALSREKTRSNGAG